MYADTSCRRQAQGQTNILGTLMAGLAQATTGLHPTEPFLDPLANALADGIAGMPVVRPSMGSWP